MNVNTTTAAPAALQAKPGSSTLGAMLEVAFLGNGNGTDTIAILNAANYPARALNGASLALSAPVGIAVSPLCSASHCLTDGNIGKARFMSIAAPASLSAGVGLMSGIRPA